MHKDKYIGLGGKIEPYEDPRTCMIREIFEEAGITCNDLTLRGIIYFKEKENVNLHPALNYLVFVYRATSFTGEISETNEGQLSWLDLEKDFPRLNLWEGDRIFVPKVLKEDKFFEAIFEYSQAEELVSYSIAENP